MARVKTAKITKARHKKILKNENYQFQIILHISLLCY